MGASKSDHFSQEQNEMALLFKALGHPARIAIMEHLLKADACICGDIVDALPLAQPTISQHLRELKSAGLIKGSIEGKAICYCIDEGGLEKMASYLKRMSTQLSEKHSSCC